jgi:two-component system KDP operon response regulator KdpE
MRKKTAHLTPTECRLLAYLVRNTGRVVSHRELLEAMSSDNTSIGNLRAYIARLREKLEIDPALPRVIVTHHRQGYSFAGKEGARWFPELEGCPGSE